MALQQLRQLGDVDGDAARGPEHKESLTIEMSPNPGPDCLGLISNSDKTALWSGARFKLPAAREGLPPMQPDLKLYDTAPFRLSRIHFMIAKREQNYYYVRDLRSTLGTIVNGEPIGDHFRGDEAPLRAGENEVIAGGVNSPFVFSVSIA